MTNLSGRFITIEGIDGAGKTCNLEWVKTLLEQAGHTVFCTREPGGTPVGEEIRDILLHHRVDGMAATSELLLLGAARAEHIAKRIRPALTRGEWVLCDRFSDATYAYQGGGRGLDMATLCAVEAVVQDGLQPDLTILLDIPVDLGQARARNRIVQDRFDKEELAFFQRVRAAYLARAIAVPHRIRVIDAALSLDDVQQQLARVIGDFLAL